MFSNNRYRHEDRVVFSHLSPEGNVSHWQYAKLFGDTRELFALDCIPDFQTQIGKAYLLKTRDMAFDLRKDFALGDTIVVSMFVSEVNGASFRLKTEFKSKDTDKVHATGTQLIVFTDLAGKPRRLPEELRALLMSVKDEQEGKSTHSTGRDVNASAVSLAPRIS